MAINAGAFEAGGSGAPTRALGVSRARTGRRILLDRWASRLVVVGGIVIIACILAILFVIAAEVYPLFKAPTAAFVGNYGTAGAGREPAPGDAVGVDEYREVAYVLTSGGRVHSALGYHSPEEFEHAASLATTATGATMRFFRPRAARSSGIIN